MASITAGVVGGLLATVVMTVLMKGLGDGGPPPTAALVAKVAGGDSGDYAMPGMVLHMGYGIVAGIVFTVGVSLLGLGLGLDSIGVAAGLGLLYGLGLMIGGMVFWLRIVIGMEPDRDAMLTFGVVHVVYGLVLGGFLGAGILG